MLRVDWRTPRPPALSSSTTASSIITYGGNHPPRYRKPVWMVAMQQPRLPGGDDPEKFKTFAFTRDEKQQLVGEVSRGERILPACHNHPDDAVRDAVPPELRIGYWRDGWVDKAGKLWMLGEMDGEDATVRRIYRTMVENWEARNAGKPEPHPFTYGVSPKVVAKYEEDTGIVHTLDMVHSCVTEQPDFGDDDQGRPDWEQGTWIQFASEDEEAIRQALEKHHFAPGLGAYVPAETLSRWRPARDQGGGQGGGGRRVVVDEAAIAGLSLPTPPPSPSSKLPLREVVDGPPAILTSGKEKVDAERERRWTELAVVASKQPSRPPPPPLLLIPSLAPLRLSPTSSSSSSSLMADAMDVVPSSGEAAASPSSSSSSSTTGEKKATGGALPTPPTAAAAEPPSISSLVPTPSARAEAAEAAAAAAAKKERDAQTALAAKQRALASGQGHSKLSHAANMWIFEAKHALDEKDVAKAKELIQLPKQLFKEGKIEYIDATSPEMSEHSTLLQQMIRDDENFVAEGLAAMEATGEWTHELTETTTRFGKEDGVTPVEAKYGRLVNEIAIKAGRAQAVSKRKEKESYRQMEQAVLERQQEAAERKKVEELLLEREEKFKRDMAARDAARAAEIAALKRERDEALESQRAQKKRYDELATAAHLPPSSSLSSRAAAIADSAPVAAVEHASAGSAHEAKQLTEVAVEAGLKRGREALMSRPDDGGRTGSAAYKSSLMNRLETTLGRERPLGSSVLRFSEAASWSAAEGGMRPMSVEKSGKHTTETYGFTYASQWA